MIRYPLWKIARCFSKGKTEGFRKRANVPRRMPDDPTLKPAESSGKLSPLPETNYNVRNGRLPFDLGAFDLDGTVLRRDLTITQASVGALRALRERGVRLVVATGRRF